jgi:N-acetylmuramoyl-L-alanine amidase
MRLVRLTPVLLFVSLLLPAQVSARAHHARPLIVALDPGHGGGGPDGTYTGAVDASGKLIEANLTFAVATRAAKDLRAMGYTVYLTRKAADLQANYPLRDLNHDGTIDQLDDYDARTLFADRHHADVFVSIHFDAAEGVPDMHGTHGYYCPDRPFWRKNKRLATILTASVSHSLTTSGYSSPDLGIGTDVADKVPQRFADYPWFFVLGPSWKKRITATAMPGALVESLFLTSPQDVAALHRPETIPAIARGYADGIRAYFGGKITH